MYNMQSKTHSSLHTDLRSLSLRNMQFEVWLARVSLFTHIADGIWRYCEVNEIIRKLYEECESDSSDASSDWHSCEGESDCCSTASGFESASGGLA